MPTRRAFVTCAAAATLRPRLLAQALAAAPTTRPNIALIDRDRILKAAALAVEVPAVRQAADSAGFLAFTLSIPALAAASIIDPAHADRYGRQAAVQLKAWFVAAETRLDDAPRLKEFELVAERSALGEMCVALPHLELAPDLRAQVKAWFASYATWLTEDRTALLARDARSHFGSSWLLQTTAAARLTANDTILSECRHRFKTSTLRAQINAEGLFPHELTTDNPFRNSLYNLDLLAGACQLLSTQFESLWDFELQDGPGMRSAIAKHAYYIADPVKWPYPADASRFKLLPCRRPALVLAGRAYQDAAYVTLWRGLNPDPTDPEILASFPIRQPLLWVTQARPLDQDPLPPGSR